MLTPTMRLDSKLTPSPDIPMTFSKRRSDARSACVFGAICGLVLTMAQGALAQANRTDATRQEIARRVPVTIVLTDHMPAGASRAAIVRRANVEPHDIILLAQSTATPDELSAALFTLMATRGVMGDTARSDATIRVPSTTGPQPWANTETPRAGRTLERLRLATPRNIPQVGIVRAYDVYLPPSKPRATTKPTPS